MLSQVLKCDRSLVTQLLSGLFCTKYATCKTYSQRVFKLVALVGCTLAVHWYADCTKIALTYIKCLQRQCNPVSYWPLQFVVLIGRRFSRGELFLVAVLSRR